MTAYLTLADGSTWRLPALLEWEYGRTDGSSCDWASIRFTPETARKKELCSACFLRLEEDGATVFYGAVDEVTATLNGGGRQCELAARGLMSLLTDSQLQAAACAVFSREDAAALAKKFGISKVTAGALGPLQEFSWQTGDSVWAVIRGYCRHAGARPRFLADGTLLLDGRSGGRWKLTENCPVEGVRFSLRRCALSAAWQTVRSGGQTETREAALAKKLGITAQKVTGQSGKGLSAGWRTAAQRLEDAEKEAVLLEITMAAPCPAEPGDLIYVSLPLMGAEGTFRLRSVCRRLTAEGRVTALELEGGMQNVAG